MLGVTNLWTYVLGTVAIVLLPGPNSMYVLSLAARRGIRAGYRGAAGVFLGDAVLMTLSASGLASLLRAYPPLFVVVKYAGAAFPGLPRSRDAAHRVAALAPACSTRRRSCSSSRSSSSSSTRPIRTRPCRSSCSA